MPRDPVLHGLFLLLVATMTVCGAGSNKPATRPALLEATKVPGSLIGIQYENWFAPGETYWQRAEAVPILGKYSSYDANLLRKHFEWFEYLGVDWLLIDWSNMLWTKPAWELHQGRTHQLEETVDVMFRTCRQLEEQGKYAPKLVFMLGLQNGPSVPDGVKRLNGILAWLKHNYLEKPEYKNLWLYYEGKPLLTVLYWPPDPCAQITKDLGATPLDAPGWTVRWMASQLQDNHADRCGMWSWMDGTIRQIVTRYQGKAEETVVTPACFQLPGKGWRHPSAVGRDHGVPYLESWKVAFESRSKFIQVHQWNEFDGEAEGAGIPADYWGLGGPEKLGQAAYADAYSVDLSDDLEPTQIDACGYRGCGGWGYYYANLTKALISLYRQETPDITIVALSGSPNAAPVKEKRLLLSWATLGKPPKGFTIQVDGKTVATGIRGASYRLELSSLARGNHQATLLAEGVHTFFDLSPEKMTVRSERPLPVTSTIKFTYAPAAE